jgi:hypothetical protein
VGGNRPRERAPSRHHRVVLANGRAVPDLSGSGEGLNPTPESKQRSIHEGFQRVFEAGLQEELGALIVALDDLSTKDLEKVMEAAQMIDSEAQDTWERRHGL